MKERPILFSAPMVRALLDGSKTQTRRAVRKQFADDAEVAEVSATTSEGWQTSGHSGLWWDDAGACLDDAVRCPYGKPGDRLWVRETFNRTNPGGDTGIYFYRADNNPAYEDAIWKPSIFMPRWASRITLEITAVRVERLQDISYEDALAEGVADARPLLGNTEPSHGETADETSRRLRWPQREYELLWNKINGVGAWNKNPWVWCVSFKRVPQ